MATYEVLLEAITVFLYYIAKKKPNACFTYFPAYSSFFLHNYIPGFGSTASFSALTWGFGKMRPPICLLITVSVVNLSKKFKS